MSKWNIKFDAHKPRTLTPKHKSWPAVVTSFAGGSITPLHYKDKLSHSHQLKNSPIVEEDMKVLFFSV
jgi:hypothetical protein